MGQRAGADLNYRFSWYLKGPYCSDLTKDYYKIDTAGAEFEAPYPEYVLRKEYAQNLDAIKDLFSVPHDVDLSRAEWVELLASLDYAQNVQKLPEDKAVAFVSREKPHLVSFIPRGLSALQTSPLHGP